MTNFDDFGAMKAIARRLKTDIDDYCANAYDDGPRTHLGASLIGHECKRYLWFVFRWVYHHKFSGRMQRLFNRGHKEEARFIEWLRGVGCEVWEFEKLLWYHAESDSYLIERYDFQKDRLDIDSQMCVDVTYDPMHVEKAKANGVVFDKGKMQFRISGVMGHFGGSMDGLIELPKCYEIDETLLAEFKTSGDSPFAKLAKNGVKLEKHQHFCQKSIYGYKYNLKHGLYVSINKNNDELHLEVIELDHELGKRLEDKAHEIITSTIAPERISNTCGFYKCKQCDFVNVCFNKQPLARNCRSCKFAKPIENASWFCSGWNQIIPKEFIAIGCNEWKPIY